MSTRSRLVFLLFLLPAAPQAEFVRVREIASGRLAGSFGTGTSTGISALAFRPDGRTLAAGLDDGRIALWDVPRPRPPAHPHPGRR